MDSFFGCGGFKARVMLGGKLCRNCVETLYEPGLHPWPVVVCSDLGLVSRKVRSEAVLKASDWLDTTKQQSTSQSEVQSLAQLSLA